MKILFLKNHEKKREGSERKESSRTRMRHFCSSTLLFHLRAGPSANRGVQQESQKCSSWRPYRLSCTGYLAPHGDLRRPILPFRGGRKAEILLGFRLEVVIAIKVEAEMSMARGIPFFLRVVFEMRGLVVLFGFWQRLALHFFQIHRKICTNRARQLSPMSPSGWYERPRKNLPLQF